MTTSTQTKSTNRQVRAHATNKAANDAIANRSATSANIGGGTLVRFSPLTADFENSLEHAARNEDWARGVKFVAVPVTTASKQDVKHACRFDSMRGYVDASGVKVFELPYPVTDMLGTSAETRNFVSSHMLGHARAIATALRGHVTDTGKITDSKELAKALGSASNGRHNGEFKKAASSYFTKFEKANRKVSDNRPTAMQPAHTAHMNQFKWTEAAWSSLAPLQAPKPEGKPNPVKWIKHECPKHATMEVKIPEGAKFHVNCTRKVKRVECGTKLVPTSKLNKKSGKKSGK